MPKRQYADSRGDSSQTVHRETGSDLEQITPQIWKEDCYG